MDGKGVINILDSASLINNGKLYSTFLLWLLSELFEQLPEVGDMDKPKFVFFFDEAHLLFNDAPKALTDKIEQVVKLIRSKGVGVYFCTQAPKDIPDGVLAQLGNKIQHGLRAYTPADQKGVKAAAESYRPNPEFDTFDTILNLGTGEAVISFLEENGVPGMAQKAYILPIQSSFGALASDERDNLIKQSLLYTKYDRDVDPDSAYEFLERWKVLSQQEADQARAEAEAAKEAERLEKERQKEAEKLAKEEAKEAERREKEKQKTKQEFARGASRAMEHLGRGLMKTFFKF